MSLSISITHRPAATASLTRLTAWLIMKFTEIQRRRAHRHMVLAVLDLGHPGVIADVQRARRN